MTVYLTNNSMTDAWFNWFRPKRKRIIPVDQFLYTIAEELIPFTETILREYGEKGSGHEGLVYWCGTRRGNTCQITAVYAPPIRSGTYGIETTHETNARFVSFLSANGLVYISQVHSHPGSIVDHSGTDDRETAFRKEGLLSVVVPSYAGKGMLPLTKCGVHRYADNTFSRLSSRYIKDHFQIQTETSGIILKDARYEK